ncbi:MAG: hypothetical protein EOO75_08290, partial [Myxococcales bacterium]
MLFTSAGLAVAGGDPGAALPVLSLVTLVLLGVAPLALVLAHDWRVTPQVHRAVAALQVGDEATVRGILDRLARWPWRRLASSTVSYLEATMAFRAGDLARSRRELDATLAAPAPWLLRPGILVLRAVAHGLRALVAALQGDVAQVSADEKALDGNPDAQPEALAMVELARAVVMLRAGGSRHAELQRHLDRHRSLLLGASLGRTRALARALLRPGVLPGHDAYRSAAGEGELASDPGTAWLRRIAPDLVPL